MIPKHSGSQDIWHEIHMGIMLKKGGKKVKRGDWRSFIGAYVLVIDYTDNKLMNEKVSRGEPWFLAKG
jgi:2-keto-4-pentenoate hydratase/2-oxohepta-3-ene-1,7-dioic acid hydratase in catechol pathway